MFGILLALIMGAEPAMMVELFPSAYRMSGYSVSFNIGIGIAGGTAPVVATALIGATGDLLAPALIRHNLKAARHDRVGIVGA
jgi:MHS family proline/betaine transporter-like MFS transporter